MTFRPKSIIVLKRETKESKFLQVTTGKKRSLFVRFYVAWQICYRFIEDKDRISKIRIEVTREK